jgi:hypothetical protein
MAEEEGDGEDDQEDLGEHEKDDAHPEADADFLFQVHRERNLSQSSAGNSPHWDPMST